MRCRACGLLEGQVRIPEVGRTRKDGTRNRSPYCRGCLTRRARSYRTGEATGVREERLPVAPLSAMIEGWLGRKLRESGLQVDGRSLSTSREELLVRLRISDRSLLRWRKGQVKMVSASIADRILTETGYLWFDVWDPVEFPEARLVWEGPE